MGFLLENIIETEALEVGAGSSAVLPLGGFVKGDPIVLITYKTCRETTAVAQKVHGICQGSLVYPYTNKVVSVATKGQAEVTAAAAVAINDYVILDATDKRKFTPATIDSSGGATTERQAFRALSIAAADGDKFIIDLTPVSIAI